MDLKKKIQIFHLRPHGFNLEFDQCRNPGSKLEDSMSSIYFILAHIVITTNFLLTLLFAK